MAATKPSPATSRRVLYAEIAFLVVLLLGCGPEGVPKDTQRDIVLLQIVCGALCVVSVFFAIQIVFLSRVRSTLRRMRPRNRAVSPGAVWFALIPVAGGVWAFALVRKLATSLRHEFEDRGWPTEGEGFGRLMGFSWAIGLTYVWFLPVLGLVLPAQKEWVVPNIFLGEVLPIGTLVGFFAYWTQVYKYSTRLRDDQGDHWPESSEHDFDDRSGRAPDEY